MKHPAPNRTLSLRADGGHLGMKKGWEVQAIWVVREEQERKVPIRPSRKARENLARVKP